MSRVIAAFSQFFDGSGAPLANGFLKFLVSGTVNTEKDTYADVDQTIPNANPLQLDGEGRCPNVFGQGIYKVILYNINPVTGLPGSMVQTFDPVIADYQSEGAGGNFAEWESGTIYQIGQIVIYNGLYYRSHIANNVGNQPDISADSWERIDFLRFYNIDVTYGLDDVVIYNSNLYFSLQAANLNHQPDISPAWWDPVGSGTILLNWIESGTAFVPIVSGYDIGSITNLVGDFFQGDNARHYFGDGQDSYLYFDSADFHAETSGNFILGTLDASEIIFNTQALARWRIKSDGHLEPDDNLNIGAALLPIGDLFQGDSQHIYLGDDQDIDITFDGTDLYLSTGINAWALLANGSILPQTDGAFYIGSASNTVKQIYVADDPTVNAHVVTKSYLDDVIYDLDRSKNYLDNGDFQIWQRATSQSTSGVLSDDRWNNSNASNLDTVTHSQQAFTIGQTDVPGEPEFYSRTVIISSSNAASLDQKYQAILNVRRLAGKTVTFSFYAKAGTTKYVYLRMVQYFGSGGSASVISVYPFTLTTSWTRYTQTLTVPSIAGKTLGTGNATLPSIVMSSGSDYSATMPNTLNQSGTFDLADLQLEDGTQATEFERQSFDKQVWRCLPCYQKTYEYGTAPGTITGVGRIIIYITGVASFTNTTYTTWSFKRPMIVTPTITTYSSVTGASGLVDVASGTVAPNVLISKERLELNGTDTIATTVRTIYFHATADTGY